MENANNNETLLARWLAGELTPEELESLQQREDFADLQAIVEGMEGLEAPAFSENDSWEKLQAKLKKEQVHKEEEPSVSDSPIIQIPKAESPPARDTPIVHLSKRETPVRSMYGWRRIMSIAAAIAAFAVALWWFTSDGSGYSTTIATLAGEQQKVTLPDGSSVQLNALSELAFSEEDWPDDRMVALKGEAYFKAKKGKTFTVGTPQGEVKVVGTQFNVLARENELAVKCTEGKVQVTNPKGNERVLIKAGEQVSVLNGRMQNRRGIDFTPKWFEGISTFKTAPLENVFAEMERQYGIMVLDKELTGRTFSGKFVHKDLEKALKMVCDPMDLRFEISGDTVRVF